MAEKIPETPAVESVKEPQSAFGQSAAEADTLTDKPPKWFHDKSFPAVVDFLVFFGIFLLAQGVGVAVGWVFFGWPDVALMGDLDQSVSLPAEFSTGHFNAASYVIAMGLTLVGFLYYRRRRRGPHILARFSLRGLNPVLLIWGVLFMLATSVALEPVLGLLPAVPDVYGRGIWMFLMVVVFAPVLEELIFRGVVLESARAKYGVTAAWLISSVVFGLVHTHPTLVVNAFVIGLVLGFIYIASSSLWAAIVLHAVNNALAYFLLVSGHANVRLIDVVGSRTVYVLIYIVSLAVLAVSGYMVYRTLRRLKGEDKNHAQG